MKHLLLLLFTATLFFGCGSDSSKKSDPEVIPPDHYNETKDGIPLLKAHPRTYLTKEQFDQRMIDCPLNEQCKKWLDDFVYPRVEQDIAAETYSGIFDLIAAHTSTDSKYQGRALPAAQFLINRRFEASGTSHKLGWQSLFVIDTVWPQLPREDKLKFLKIIQQSNEFYYASEKVTRETRTGYHEAWGRSDQLAAAVMIYDDPILKDSEVIAHPEIYQNWNPEDFIFALTTEAAPGGYWNQLEGYLAGEMSYNTALRGSNGGLYDNFGYDNAEEARSVMLSLVLRNSTGTDYHLNNLRDRYKGLFWQVMRVPHSGQQYCLWDTQTSCNVSNLNLGSVLVHLYRDPRMKQLSFNPETDRLYESGVPEQLLFYDIHNEITPQGPEDLPLATYFSGNGIVAMRESWSSNSPFGVFISGEHISRRYGDVNSFGLHRKTKITGVAGGRIRFNENNDRHHWFARRSISKNILTVCDPGETIDYDSNGNLLPAGSGKILATHHNFCGQKPEEQMDSADGEQTGRRPQLQIPDVDNMGDILRFEQQDNQYAYTLGDGHFNYSSKVKQYHRAFLHLNPDTFIVYDRVETKDPDFQTAIIIHTPDQIASPAEPSETADGLKEWEQPQRLEVDNLIDYATFQTLLPKTRRVKVRGGRTLLIDNGTLQANSSKTFNKRFQTPRLIEFTGYNPADHTTMNGVVITIQGDSEVQNNDTEEIVFTGGGKELYAPLSFRQGARTDTTLTSKEVIDPWYEDQWAGWIAQKSSGETAIITGNSADTLQGDFTGEGYWQCKLYKFHGHTTRKWKRITGVTANRDVAGIDLGVSHFFDVEDVAGNLHSFMPDSDGETDSYRLHHKKYGTHTASIIDQAVTTDHHFLTAITVTDSGETVADATLVEGEHFYGAIIGEKAVLFGQSFTPFSGNDTITLPVLIKELIITDLKPGEIFFIQQNSDQLQITTGGDGVEKTASENGVITVTFY